MSKNNIVLIGMPGAGKSTVGVVLAKKLGYKFIDSDIVIQEKTGKLLHEITAERGVEGFRQVENEINASLKANHSVIATGGSVVYGAEAMKHLRDIGEVVYLELPYGEIESRLGDLTARGVSMQPGQTLKDLYDERIPLYERYADVVEHCSGMSLRSVVEDIYGRYRD